ncbi:MAG: hypothetical protein Q7R35_18200 [Elusimicrobiota bacterium]|nr:hypothetical protein [Elusimicrobiota bacterium]
MKKVLFLLASLLLGSDLAFSEVKLAFVPQQTLCGQAAKNLEDVSASVIKETGVPAVSKPAPVSPVTPPGANIANYVTDEEFSFESQAKPAMDARIAVLKAAGITTLGGRVVETPGRDYTFVIDYLPTVKNGAAMPPAVIIETYKNGASYWLDADAQAAISATAANLRNAQIPVLGSYMYDAGNDSAFAVDYAVKNLLRPTPEYNVVFNNYQGGKFTFESEAKKNIDAYAAVFKAAGVPVIRGKAVERPDGDWAVQLEYAVKNNRYGARPQFSIARYDAQEIFTFDKEALKASKERLPVFSKAGVPPVSNIVRPEGRDYSFSIDYIVGNIYQQGGVIPSVAIETYQAPETFTFDTEAKKAMAEKAAAFNAADMAVVGSRVTGSLGSFSYALDYVVKAGNVPAPHNFQ